MEMTVQATELADTPPDCSTVFVVENEIAYLAFPPPPRPLYADRPPDAASPRGALDAEPKPVNAHLQLLTHDEAALYTDLVEGVLDDAIRLEQERVRFCAIERALYALYR